MRKIKIFRFSEFNDGEATVNEWLAERPKIKVVGILQSESCPDPEYWTLTITIFYYEGE